MLLSIMKNTSNNKLSESNIISVLSPAFIGGVNEAFGIDGTDTLLS